MFAEHKTLDLKVTDQGTVEAVFSTFDIVDRDGDVITREALAPYDGAEVPMTASHDWSLQGWIGKGRIMVEDMQARFVGSFLMDDPDGQAAFRKVKAFQGLSQWSWAFRPNDIAWEQHDGAMIRVIKSLVEKPYEVSPVLVGANQNTGTVGIKSDVKAEWDAAYINKLPDSAFAVILAGGEKDEEGKTVPRSLRKLPHHNDAGSVDVPHLRNALSREPQADMPDAAHSRARAHLKRHAAAEGVGTEEDGKASAAVLVALDHLEEQDAELTPALLSDLHDAFEQLKAIHGEACEKGDECPMAVKITAPNGRVEQLRELEKVLGYKPLIAGAVQINEGG